VDQPCDGTMPRITEDVHCHLPNLHKNTQNMFLQVDRLPFVKRTTHGSVVMEYGPTFTARVADPALLPRKPHVSSAQRRTKWPNHTCTPARSDLVNPLTPNDHHSGRTAPLTSKRFILYVYSTNIGTEYFKHGIYSPFFPPQNAVCFIILTYLVPVLFIIYIQSVYKILKNNSGAKRLSQPWARCQDETNRLRKLTARPTAN